MLDINTRTIAYHACEEFLFLIALANSGSIHGFLLVCFKLPLNYGSEN